MLAGGLPPHAHGAIGTGGAVGVDAHGVHSGFNHVLHLPVETRHFLRRGSQFEDGQLHAQAVTAEKACQPGSAAIASRSGRKIVGEDEEHGSGAGHGRSENQMPGVTLSALR